MTSKPKLLEIISFGRRYGRLESAPEMSYDVRTIPNPPRELRLQQKLTGDPTAVRQWLLANEVFRARLEEARKDILQLLSLTDETRSAGEYHHLTIGVNCAMGRHRSVTFANALRQNLDEELGTGSTWDIRVRHRDLWRQSSK